MSRSNPLTSLYEKEFSQPRIELPPHFFGLCSSRLENRCGICDWEGSLDSFFPQFSETLDPPICCTTYKRERVWKKKKKNWRTKSLKLGSSLLGVVLDCLKEKKAFIINGHKCNSFFYFSLYEYKSVHFQLLLNLSTFWFDLVLVLYCISFKPYLIRMLGSFFFYFSALVLEERMGIGPTQRKETTSVRFGLS